MWSRAIRVITATSGGPMTLVASNRPPSPTSSIATSQPRSANQESPQAVTSSNSVGISPSLSSTPAAAFTRVAVPASSSFVIHWNPTCMRSRKSST